MIALMLSTRTSNLSTRYSVPCRIAINKYSMGERASEEYEEHNIDQSKGENYDLATWNPSIVQDNLISIESFYYIKLYQFIYIQIYPIIAPLSVRRVIKIKSHSSELCIIPFPSPYNPIQHRFVTHQIVECCVQTTAEKSKLKWNGKFLPKKENYLQSSEYKSRKWFWWRCGIWRWVWLRGRRVLSLRKTSLKI